MEWGRENWIKKRGYGRKGGGILKSNLIRIGGKKTINIGSWFPSNCDDSLNENPTKPSNEKTPPRNTFFIIKRINIDALFGIDASLLASTGAQRKVQARSVLFDTSVCDVRTNEIGLAVIMTSAWKTVSQNGHQFHYLYPLSPFAPPLPNPPTSPRYSRNSLWLARNRPFATLRLAIVSTYVDLRRSSFVTGIKMNQTDSPPSHFARKLERTRTKNRTKE